MLGRATRAHLRCLLEPTETGVALLWRQPVHVELERIRDEPARDPDP